MLIVFMVISLIGIVNCGQNKKGGIPCVGVGSDNNKSFVDQVLGNADNNKGAPMECALAIFMLQGQRTATGTSTGMATGTATGTSTGTATGTATGTVTATGTFSIGGTIAGLTASGLVLQNNAADDLTVTSGATTFKFVTKVSGTYGVTVKTQPANNVCTISNGSGTATVDISNISIMCIDTFTRLTGAAAKATGISKPAISSSGNIYINGNTGGGLDGQALTGVQDLYVKKFNGSGTILWTKQMGVAGSSIYSTSIAIDASENVYVTGFTDGNGLDGQASIGTRDAFVVKFDSSGTKQWTKLIGVATFIIEGYGIATDSIGNVYVTGMTYSNLYGETRNGNQDVFVIKYDSNGTRQWTRLSGITAGTTYGKVISTDMNGNVFTVGYTYDGGGLDGQPLNGDQDVFVIKYDSNGTKQWTRLSGPGTGSMVETSFGIANDSSGNAYIAGSTTGGIDGQALTGTRDAFAIKYSSNGVKQWTKLAGVATKVTRAFGISSDSSGNIYTTGYTNGNLDGQTRIGIQDAFIIKYNSSGTKQWTKLIGVASKTATVTGAQLGQNGFLYVTGTINGNLDGQVLTGTIDAFLTNRIAP